MHYDFTDPPSSSRIAVAERRGSRAAVAIASRGRNCDAYWGDFDPDDRAPHPAIPTPQQMQSMLRIFLVGVALTICFLALGGCAVTDHRDGGGYTVRYAGSPAYGEPAAPAPRPRKIVHKASSKPVPEPAVVLVEPGRDHDRGESHPVLNLGKDDEIPREYRHYVSDRSVRTLRARLAMCKEQRPGYCNSPNIPHCHGPFCHAHAGGDKRHTH